MPPPWRSAGQLAIQQLATAALVAASDKHAAAVWPRAGHSAAVDEPVSATPSPAAQTPR